ncbi:MAG: sensor histidine kinase [Enterocloster sp.]
MQENKIHFRKTLYFKMIVVTLFLGAVFFGALYTIYKMSCHRFEEELTYHSDTLTEQICRNVEVSLKELSEKTVPLTVTNERFGPILAQIEEKAGTAGPLYAELRIQNNLDEFLGMNYEINWMSVVDRENEVYLAHRDPRRRVEMPDKSELLELYHSNEKNLADRLGNTVWISSSNPDGIILMRSVFDSDSMRFCGCIIAEVKNDSLKEIFDNIDSTKAGEFTLYDRNGIAIYSTEKGETSEGTADGEQNKIQAHRNDLLQSEYSISRGKLKIIHRVDIREKKQRFSDLLNLISLIGLTVYLAVILFLWLMFGNMAVNLKILLGNLRRAACGDFSWAPTHFSSGDELDLVSQNIREMSVHLKQLMEQEVRSKELQQQDRYNLLEARYHELQAQVNPHFLFNILQSINGIAQINRDMQVSRLICMLSKFFRGNIDRRYSSCELREELEYARNYLELYNNIYPDRLDIQWDADESLMDIRIPTYILQPIVENSIVHGMEPRVGTCTIRISVSREQGRLVIIIWDNGEGIPPDKLSGLLSTGVKSKRVGIRNVQDRIQIRYGEEYGLSITSEYHCYTEVKIILPLPS